MWERTTPQLTRTKKVADEETDLAPAGYGCFSFQRGLLHGLRVLMRSAVQATTWLLEGPAVTISRKNWNILSLNRKCTMTDYYLLQAYFRNGFPSGERDNERRPFVVPHPKTRISHPKYLKNTIEIGEAKAQPGFLATKPYCGSPRSCSGRTRHPRKSRVLCLPCTTHPLRADTVLPLLPQESIAAPPRSEGK